MRLRWLLFGLLSCLLLVRGQIDEGLFDEDDDGDFGGFDMDGGMEDMDFDGEMPLDFGSEGDMPAPAVLVTMPYSRPPTDGLMMAETFDDPIDSSWVKSNDEKYQGTWLHRERKREVMTGDKGLEIEREARHVAISRKVPVVTPDAGDLIIHYEVNAQDGHTCGGAYMKLFDTQGKPLEEFSNDTPYTIMFGPDKCGSTNKVHVIFRTKNPTTGEWSEHHLKTPPTVPTYGDFTHRYTLVIYEDDTVELFIDDKAAHKANMHTDFEPAFSPPEEIDDPEDTKPEDWTDEKEIADPTAEKPEDWDEDAPARIPDPDDEMPEGWLVDEPTTIVDPTATEPDDWEADTLGEWTPPNMKNPLCTVGCGPYTHKTLPNPAYKGKWVAPKIPNPEYKGPWKAQRIANPAYFNNEHPHVLGAAIDAVGFELWTMNPSIHFDNIVLARSYPAVEAFVAKTWTIRHALEAESANAKRKEAKAAEAKASGEKSILENFRLLGGIGAIVFIFSLVTWRLCISPGMKAPTKKKEGEKKDGAKENDQSGEEEASKKEEEETDKKDDTKEGGPRRRKGAKE